MREKKKEARHFSQRYLHAKIGVSPSSGFLANVIAGKKNLTITQVRKLAQIMKLSRSETAFFEDLVAYNHAKTIEEKNEYLSRLVAKQKIKLSRLRPNQFNLFSQWYYVFIRELLAYFPVRDNYSEVAALLDPPVKPSQVREALDAMEAMKLIKRDDKGYYAQRESFVSTGDEVNSLDLAHFQFQTMDMGKRALQTLKAEERDISVVSCALSEKGYDEAKEAIREFRKRLLKIAENDDKLDRVYHCNIQFFPVTRKNGKPGSPDTNTNQDGE